MRVKVIYQFLVFFVKNREIITDMLRLIVDQRIRYTVLYRRSPVDTERFTLEECHTSKDVFRKLEQLRSRGEYKDIRYNIEVGRVREVEDAKK